jgi:Dolichyl-phosphate-mannose-protein mannosyltransferase
VTLTARAQTWIVTLCYAILTIIMTWPLAAHLMTHAHGHYDVYFNMWRVAWIAHALTTAPFRLFDANIFYPEPRTLTYSDAMLVEGALGTPLLAIGFPPVLVHNLLLLGAIVSSATGIFVLTRHLTGSATAGFVSGIIFAFVPYRFDHFMHLELQWTMWMPWAFWALHRTLEGGGWKYGALIGVFVALQMLSSIYYGVFLIPLLGLVTLVLLVPRLWARTLTVRDVAPLGLGAAIGLVVCSLYAQPYLATKHQVRGRTEDEVRLYSARPWSYLSATPENVLYGKVFGRRGRPELRLFPGGLAILLAIVGLARKNAAATRIGYLLAIAAAYDFSLGFEGYSYSFIVQHVAALNGLRALARAGVLVIFFVTVLAAFGYDALASERRGIGRRLLFAIIVVVLLAEYRCEPLPLERYPNEPPALYAWLAQQPKGIVAELPMPFLDHWPGPDPRISYMSTFHWRPLVNGYSGYLPISYALRLDAVREFPDGASVEYLRAERVRYLILHLVDYTAEDAVTIVNTLKNRDRLEQLGRFDDGRGEAVVFRLR